MINAQNASTEFMSDIVFMAQRASAETCDVAARTIARQALKFMRIYRQNITNVAAYQDGVRELCECLLLLRNEIANPNEVILIRRDALDLLLLISRQLVYPNLQQQEQVIEPELDVIDFA